MSAEQTRIARRRRLAQAAAHEARKRAAKRDRRPRGDELERETREALREARRLAGARS